MAEEQRNPEHPAVKFSVAGEEMVVHATHLTVREIFDISGWPAADHYLIELRADGGDGERFENLDQSVALRDGLKFDIRRRADRKYVYFVDGEPFESAEAFITGAIIRSKLPDAKREYALYLEGHGSEPDRLINNDTTVELKGKEPKRFYTVPPASFGAS
jgi:hypothetical protein